MAKKKSQKGKPKAAVAKVHRKATKKVVRPSIAAPKKESAKTSKKAGKGQSANSSAKTDSKKNAAKRKPASSSLVDLPKPVKTATNKASKGKSNRQTSKPTKKQAKAEVAETQRRSPKKSVKSTATVKKKSTPASKRPVTKSQSKPVEVHRSPIMKLHFESDLPYQAAAIEAVCDLFRGQEICRTEFTVTRDFGIQRAVAGLEDNLGIGNRLTLLDDELLKNLNDIQLRNGLAPSTDLTSGDFTVEMETGTGKTYVYLRSFFELNKRFGFTKFVVVVPSIAIKEGVYKSLQIMEDHFRGIYANVPFEYFLYDSGKLGQVRNFATSPHIQIMVVTVGAINKQDVNNLYKETEKTGGEKPIDLIKATRPILIVDEPQSVDGGLQGRGKEALNMMNPLCTLRYSATHADKHHMVYRLDAVDAYEKQLVKQIEVASAGVEGGFNKPYVRLLSVRSKRMFVSATVELDMQTAGGVRRQEVDVQDGENLEQVTGRAVYENCSVGEIRTVKGKEFLELKVPGGEHFLKLGEAFGNVDPMMLQREMIRRTIKEHLDKELRLAPSGIKVLSLFFIDSVERYRKYDEDGNAVKGIYADIFEEEYRRLSRHPDYKTLFANVDTKSAPEEVHNGYFSIDKKGGWSDTAENNQGNRDNAERAYNLIMREKEKLLSFETKLKFIFSHSALREGWDNPNVFQICALREMGTERERRQTIGRGLRLG